MTKLLEFKNHKKETLRGLFNKANSPIGIICLHGMERTTTEYKFKNIVDRLKGKVSIFRFDFAGCGISDGSFSDFTVEDNVKTVGKAIKILKKQNPKITKIVLVAHSLSGATALQFTHDNPDKVYKLALLGPALNQKDLHQYFFVSYFNQDKKITWDNYSKYFNNAAYKRYLNKPLKISKAHYFGQKYFNENINKDYQDLFKTLKLSLKNILIIQGTKDSKVPPASNDRLPKEIKQIMVKAADHDFQKVNMTKQYLTKMINFIKS